MSTLPYVLTSLAILLTPGPTNTLLAASGAASGLRRAALLPVAEAAGYATALGAYIVASDLLSDVPIAFALAKAVAAAWLLACAVGLWSRPVVADARPGANAFRRIFLTTILNPKAMLVGAIVIPSLMRDREATATLIFVCLSTVAGLGWAAFGALLPARLRRHSYRAAAIAIAGFSLAAAASTFQA